MHGVFDEEWSFHFVALSLWMDVMIEMRKSTHKQNGKNA
jgi:hypothetical protein